LAIEVPPQGAIDAIIDALDSKIAADVPTLAHVIVAHLNVACFVITRSSSQPAKRRAANVRQIHRQRRLG
jgi:hypothetical protein